MTDLIVMVGISNWCVTYTGVYITNTPKFNLNYFSILSCTDCNFILFYRCTTDIPDNSSAEATSQLLPKSTEVIPR